MKSIIFGVAGQCGSYLAEHLLSLGYDVIGVARKDITYYPKYVGLLAESPRFKYAVADVLDQSSIAHLLHEHQPYQIYNLAGQTNVFGSFSNAASTFRTNIEPCLAILETMRVMKHSSRFFQACSSEMYGSGGLKNENSEFKPLSPYGISKLSAHRLVDLYRSRHSLFAVSGILFNNESSRRGLNFVTRKIARYVAELSLGKTKKKLELGNLSGTRDFGYSPSFVRGFRAAIQRDTPDDYVFGTGQLTSVQELCEIAFSYVGKNWSDYVETKDELLRPVDFVEAVADTSKAKKLLGWQNSKPISFIMEEIINHEKKEICSQT